MSVGQWGVENLWFKRILFYVLNAYIENHFDFVQNNRKHITVMHFQWKQVGGTINKCSKKLLQKYNHDI